jgi:hypothetical protein
LEDEEKEASRGAEEAFRSRSMNRVTSCSLEASRVRGAFFPRLLLFGFLLLSLPFFLFFLLDFFL